MFFCCGFFVLNGVLDSAVAASSEPQRLAPCSRGRMSAAGYVVECNVAVTRAVHVASSRLIMLKGWSRELLQLFEEYIARSIIAD